MSTIIKPTWSVDGWIGNSVDGNGTHWFINKDRGWFQPLGVRNYHLERPVGNGDFVAPKTRQSRVITLAGFCRALTPDLSSQAVDQFNGLLAAGNLYTLTVDEGTRTMSAAVELGTDPDSELLNRRDFRFQLVLIAPDPRKLWVNGQFSGHSGLTTASSGGITWNGPAGTTGSEWNGPAGSTGTEWNGATAPVGSSGQFTLTNPGTAPADIVFTVTGPVTNPVITNLTTGQRIAYGGSLLAGETLVIDTGARSVLFQGVNRGPLLTQADWFGVPAGRSVVVAFTASTSDPAADLAGVGYPAYY